MRSSKCGPAGRVRISSNQVDKVLGSELYVLSAGPESDGITTSGLLCYKCRGAISRHIRSRKLEEWADRFREDSGNYDPFEARRSADLEYIKSYGLHANVLVHKEYGDIDTAEVITRQFHQRETFETGKN